MSSFRFNPDLLAVFIYLSVVASLPASAQTTANNQMSIDKILTNDLLNNKKLSILQGSGNYKLKIDVKGFESYANSKFAIYVNRNCDPSKFSDPFYLHVYPKDKFTAANVDSDVSKYGFHAVNFEFNKADASLINGKNCVAVMKLPGWGITKIGMGQFNVKTGLRPWDNTIENP